MYESLLSLYKFVSTLILSLCLHYTWTRFNNSRN